MSIGVSPAVMEVKVVDQVVYVTLNRPQSMNALSQELVSRLIEFFGKYRAADVEHSHQNNFGDIRAIVLRGAGGNFCGGGDVKEMADMVNKSNDGDLEGIAAYNIGAGLLFQAIESSGVPVIAVVEGVALGGGLGLACAVDVTIARSEAVFGLPETTLGLVPAQVAPFIRRRVGQSHARVMAVVGGRFDATEAQRVGIVHYIVKTDDELESTLSDLLSKIKKCAPNGVACAKQLMTETPAAASMEPKELAALFARHMASEEGCEGTAAFVQKRKPNWCR